MERKPVGCKRELREMGLGTEVELAFSWRKRTGQKKSQGLDERERQKLREVVVSQAVHRQGWRAGQGDAKESFWEFFLNFIGGR